jgi:ADP-heptose:LPS heptosyltransferase
MRGERAAFFPNARFSLALAAFLARVPKRIGTGYRWYSFLFTDKIYEHRKTAERNEAEYNLRMLKALGIETNVDGIASIELRKEERTVIQKWIDEKLGGGSFAVLHIGSGGSAQAWPVNYFIEAGQSIAHRGMKIVLTGTPEEEAAIRTVSKSIGAAAIPFIGHSLPELAALLERAEIVITNSTGPGHLAATLGTPTIGLFPLPLAISKERWGFRGAKAVNLSPDPLPECPNCAQCNCMERLTPKTVELTLEKIVTQFNDVKLVYHKLV